MNQNNFIELLLRQILEALERIEAKISNETGSSPVGEKK